MDLIKCPECGELYSSSYPRCPFCEEDGARPRRAAHTPKRRIADRQKSQSARGALIAVLVLVLALLGWYLFGDSIIHRGEKTPSPTPDTQQTSPNTEPDGPSVPAISTSGGQSSEGASGGQSGGQTAEPIVEPDPVTPPVDENVDVSNAKLNREDFTLGYAGEKFTIKVSGTEATPRWSIDNANVASIAADGTVTAVANGDTTVRCQVGTRELTCTVRVRNTGRTAAAAGAPTTAEPVTPVAPAAPGTATETPPAPSTPSTPVTTPSTPTTPPSSDTHVDASSLNVKTNYGTTLQKDPGTGYPDCTVRIDGDPISLRVIGTDVPVSGWTSDKTSVVEISNDGKLTPVSVGTAHVTATVGDAKITCIIRVR